MLWQLKILKRIHVNQHIIKSNKKNNKTDPVLTIKTYNSNTLANQIKILDDSGKIIVKVIYRPNKPLSCGAHVWIETEQKILATK